MNDYTEFSQPLAPEKTTGAIISHAWESYKPVILYGIGFLAFMFVASTIVTSILQMILGIESNDQELANEIMRTKDYNLIFKSPAFVSKSSIGFFIGLIFYPLYAGFMYMVHKANIKQEASFSDLFIGYRQNTLQIILYGFLSQLLISIGLLLCVVPGIILASLLFMGLPVVFFENKSAVQGLQKSFEIAKKNFGIFLGVAVLAFLIGISGILLCCIGLLASWPFIGAAMYSTYCAFSGTPHQVEQQQ